MFIAAAVPLRLLGALLFALLLHPKFRGVSAYRTDVYLPTVVPDVAFALLALWIFNPLYGPLNLVLDSIGAPTPVAHRSARRPLGGGADGLFRSAKASSSRSPSGRASRTTCSSWRRSRARPVHVFAGDPSADGAGTRSAALPDTIFSFQANFVPALLIFDGAPRPTRRPICRSSSTRMRSSICATGTRLQRPCHVRRHGADRLRAVADSAPLATSIVGVTEPKGPDDAPLEPEVARRARESRRTPALVLGGVGVLIAVVVAILAVIAFLIFWLA